MDESREAELASLRRRLNVATRPGNWFFFGAIGALALTTQFEISVGWTFIAALVAGCVINEWERKAGA